jgi:hypothetical protein
MVSPTFCHARTIPRSFIALLGRITGTSSLPRHVVRLT